MNLKYSNEIISMLCNEGINLTQQQINTIESICYDININGYVEGVIVGIKQGKISLLKDQIEKFNNRLEELE